MNRVPESPNMSTPPRTVPISPHTVEGAPFQSWRPNGAENTSSSTTEKSRLTQMKGEGEGDRDTLDVGVTEEEAVAVLVDVTDRVLVRLSLEGVEGVTLGVTLGVTDDVRVAVTVLVDVRDRVLVRLSLE